ncbi:hypothetical protein BANRA_05484 [Escherichia coli]|uniref:Uncharacterized protein n=1 Tax=Escherichia coli TaxID=562 RepID=A0A3P5HC93_ECOLX|nr:hypothetical protein BANRA_05484 [Escherichia coli]
MALGGLLVIAILCGVATFCVSGLYLKSLCLSVALLLWGIQSYF